ncbi:hypothetical protein [Allochromatium vinosum]|uniref:hypothetical protein n=1 Tax=Allochromatium vinosum TaxID=1049 RepID=UPI001907EE60|nr:hypothetical protein [Allochromatium vinosum]MBK1656550.1 hypothetical protein [Allochromatium vinosum]
MNLSKDDLLVLFEFLHRFCETEKIAFSHYAEAVVLDKIDGQLERTLSEPFMEDYPKLLGQARDRILKEYESKMGNNSWIHELELNQT